MISDTCGQGGEGESKMAENLRTSFMYDPLALSNGMKYESSAGRAVQGGCNFARAPRDDFFPSPGGFVFYAKNCTRG